MEEEKIFKDLTKKYADLAKKIHSKDRRSMSLIKDCSKRIALLDKLRVLEGSYLKCLKNKVKRGQKGGAPGDSVVGDNKEDKEDEESLEDENKFRAIVACTRAVENGIDAYNGVKGMGVNAATTIREKGAIFKEKAKSFFVVEDARDNTATFPNRLFAKGVGAVKSFGNLFQKSPSEEQKTAVGGGKKTTYKLNGEKVVLLHKNKKVQRSIYVKGNGKTKYCKIDHQYILLSKLKNKIQ
jgi:hypothetical protein